MATGVVQPKPSLGKFPNSDDGICLQHLDCQPSATASKIKSSSNQI